MVITEGLLETTSLHEARVRFVYTPPSPISNLWGNTGYVVVFFKIVFAYYLYMVLCFFSPPSYVNYAYQELQFCLIKLSYLCPTCPLLGRVLWVGGSIYMYCISTSLDFFSYVEVVGLGNGTGYFFVFCYAVYQFLWNLCHMGSYKFVVFKIF